MKPLKNGFVSWLWCFLIDLTVTAIQRNLVESSVFVLKISNYLDYGYKDGYNK